MSGTRQIPNRRIVDEAVASYSRGEGTLREIAERFQVSRTTLHRRVKRGIGGPKEEPRRGPRPYLQSSEEILATWAKYLAQKGFPLKRKDLQAAAKRIIDSGPNGCDPFNGKLPGKKWMRNFMRRNNLIEKVQVRSKGKVALNEETVNEWFKKLPHDLNNRECADILLEARRIFNCDETAFIFSKKRGKFICEKRKPCIRVSVPPEKENLRALVRFNTSGESAPTMIINKYKKLPGECTRQVPEAIVPSSSPSNWMRAENFQLAFDRFLKTRSIERPLVTFKDDHRKRLFPESRNFDEEKDIIVCCLPSKNTHVLQPADVGVLDSIKKLWGDVQHRHSIKNKGAFVNKNNFATLRKNTVTLVKNETLKKCAIYPCEPEVSGSSECVREPEKPELTNACYRKGLQVIESLMETPLVEKFRECLGESWTGDLKYEGLYEIWEGMVNKISIMEHSDEDKNSDIDCDLGVTSETGSTTVTATSTDIESDDDQDADDDTATATEPRLAASDNDDVYIDATNSTQQDFPAAVGVQSPHSLPSPVPSTSITPDVPVIILSSSYTPTPGSVHDVFTVPQMPLKIRRQVKVLAIHSAVADEIDQERASTESTTEDEENEETMTFTCGECNVAETPKKEEKKKWIKCIGCGVHTHLTCIPTAHKNKYKGIGKAKSRTNTYKCPSCFQITI